MVQSNERGLSQRDKTDDAPKKKVRRRSDAVCLMQRVQAAPAAFCGLPSSGIIAADINAAAAIISNAKVQLT